MKRTGYRNNYRNNYRTYYRKPSKPVNRIAVATSILLMAVFFTQVGFNCIDGKSVVEAKKETVEVVADNAEGAADFVGWTAQAIGDFEAMENAAASDVDETEEDEKAADDIKTTDLPESEIVVPEYSITVYDEEKSYYSNDRVNIRTGAGTEFDRLATIKRDTKVTVLGETDNGWYQVMYNDEVGYIMGDYIQETEPGIEYIFAGDSRTVQMSQAVNKSDYAWIAKVGEGYSFFSNEAVPQIDAEAGDGSVIIINYGVNDLYNAEKYIKLINKKVDSWIAAGATVFYAAVTPVSSYPTITNSDIEAFNSEMRSGLDSRIGWLDGYSFLTNVGFSTGDGLHYNNDTYKTLYTYYMNQVAAQKEA
ncbi:SH3 domain-containing protein [Butyrivibrio sp. VCD2006]|uniref:SH3 domain-containing protein n=1 Tax=Butyrivibrio sp. VCD2006 TaxID=1280664 RepID=UPI000414CBF8|nr:SH3 domain-containing protein [Butyrivibrio sp. VCD2006]